MRTEFPASEVVYRSVLQIMAGHSIALERLGRVYLRYRETIPAAVQCFFKSVETNPSNHVAWYLLGRCYMATAQYSDACEAYNRAINLNPNDPQVWCSLGVLYYAFGQYREALGMFARALRLDSTMADAWYNVGALYDMCDQPEDAQQAYMKAREYGLADRFARAGVGLNPLAMQSIQYISGASSGAGTSTSSSPAATSAGRTHYGTSGSGAEHQQHHVAMSGMLPASQLSQASMSQMQTSTAAPLMPHRGASPSTLQVPQSLPQHHQQQQQQQHQSQPYQGQYHTGGQPSHSGATEYGF